MTQTMYRFVVGALVILLLASVARFYHPGFGFTALLGLSSRHQNEAPQLQRVPHYDPPTGGGYDGTYYVQRALDPLVRDPAVDRAMDLAPFRARRILFSWTAWLLGLGRPSWIVEAYALQNVGFWLILAVLLTRWVAPTTARGLALWIACLFANGVLMSIRLSLLDLPSLTLIAGAVLAAERGRVLLSSALIGISGLGRETNILAAVALPLPSDRAGWRRLLPAAALVVLPMAVWLDYLRSIYRSTLLEGTGQLVMPLTGLASAWAGAVRDLPGHGPWSPEWGPFLLLLSLAAQALYLVVRRDIRSAWWRVACTYAALMLVLSPVLADPHTGAITRVLLPLTIGFNVQLARETSNARFWLWFVVGNLDLLVAPRVLPLFPFA